MKFQKELIATAYLVQHAFAFPRVLFEQNGIGSVRRRDDPSISGTDVPETIRTFDPTLQYVSNTGDHAWVAPGPEDLRGPCPGLNAMANHGYIPHNGVATIPVDLLVPIWETSLLTCCRNLSKALTPSSEWGPTLQLFWPYSTLRSACVKNYLLMSPSGSVEDGNLDSWSIGGPPPSLLGLGGNGLIGSHNKYVRRFHMGKGTENLTDLGGGRLSYAAGSL